MQHLKPMPYYKSTLTEGKTMSNVKRRRVSDSGDGIAKLIVVIAILVGLSISLLVVINKQRDAIALESAKSTALLHSLESQKIKASIFIDENKKLELKINKLSKEVLDIISKRVKVTGYHPNSGGINSDANPDVTATMTPHKAGYTCAISTELVDAGWLGREIYIDGFGMVLANDRLAPGIKGYQIDLCKGSYNDAMKVGENFNVLATLVSREFIKQKLEEN